jgi:hypothetical protein
MLPSLRSLVAKFKKIKKPSKKNLSGLVSRIGKHTKRSRFAN